MAPELPARIDRYRILEMLGRGSMGYVYLAIDPKLDRRVALKVMSSHRLGEDDELDELRMRFVQEARAAARLGHPGIVTVFDADTDEATGWPFIAMEWVNGTSLRSRLRSDGQLEVRTAVGLVAQVARALDYAHREGVVHRDVKPANLLLDEQGTRAKIADFGVAKLVSNSLTLTGQVLGSPNYMAPEQVKAQEVDGRTDLFGLGVVLYECLAGRPAFASDSLASITFKIVSVDPRPVEIYNPRVPPALGALVRRALEKRPGDRFQTGAEMADALDSVARELDIAPEHVVTRQLRPVSTDPVTTFERDSPTTLGRRGAWRALAAALVAVAAFLGVAQWALEPAIGELPLLTRKLGLFKSPDGTSRAELEAAAASASAAGEEPGAGARSAAAEQPVAAPPLGTRPAATALDPHPARQPAENARDLDSSGTGSPDPPDSGGAAGALQETELETAGSPAAGSPAVEEQPTAETGAGIEPPIRPPPAAEDEATAAMEETRPTDPAPEILAAASAASQPAELTPPPIPRTRLTVVVDNKIRLAMVSVWIDRRRVLTRRLQTKNVLKRWVGEDYHFDIPVTIGAHKIEVHISGLSSSLEARGVIRGELRTGRAAVLDVDIDRRHKKLNLSWRS